MPLSGSMFTLISLVTGILVVEAVLLWQTGNRHSPLFPKSMGMSALLSLGFMAVWMLASVVIWHIYRYKLWKPTRDTPVELNWDGRHKLATESVHFPGSVEEVINLVKDANQTNRRVKVVGAGHSWSDIAVPVDMHVSLDRLNKVLEVDKENKRVTVEAGIRLIDLYRALDNLDPPLALPNVPSVNEQSVAGALCTNTHGSGARHTPMPRLVVSMEIVDGEGKLRKIDRKTPGDVLNAVRISLGCLGIITKVTLQLVTAFDVVVKEHVVTESQFYEQLESYVRDFEFAKFWMIPHTGSVVVYEIKKSDTRKGRSSGEALINSLKGYGMELAQMICAAYPSLQTFSNKYLLLDNFMKTKYRSGISHEQLIINYRIPYHTELEYAVPASKAKSVIKKLQEFLKGGPIQTGFIHEIRFVQNDCSWLSTGYTNKSDEEVTEHNSNVKNLLEEGELVCHITIGLFSPSFSNLYKYFTTFEDIALQHGGRPHWGKVFYATKSRLRQALPKIDEFEEFRSKWDPKGIFRNKYIDRVLELK